MSQPSRWRTKLAALLRAATTLNTHSFPFLLVYAHGDAFLHALRGVVWLASSSYLVIRVPTYNLFKFSSVAVPMAMLC